MTKAKSFQLLNFNFPVRRIFSISTMDIYDVYQDLYAPLSSSPFGCNLLYGTADGDEEGGDDNHDDHGNCHVGNGDNGYDVGRLFMHHYAIEACFMQSPEALSQLQRSSFSF